MYGEGEFFKGKCLEANGDMLGERTVLGKGPGKMFGSACRITSLQV